MRANNHQTNNHQLLSSQALILIIIFISTCCCFITITLLFCLYFSQRNTKQILIALQKQTSIPSMSPRHFSHHHHSHHHQHNFQNNTQQAQATIIVSRNPSPSFIEGKSPPPIEIDSTIETYTNPLHSEIASTAPTPFSKRSDVASPIDNNNIINQHRLNVNNNNNKKYYPKQSMSHDAMDSESDDSTSSSSDNNLDEKNIQLVLDGPQHSEQTMNIIHEIIINKHESPRKSKEEKKKEEDPDTIIVSISSPRSGIGGQLENAQQRNISPRHQRPVAYAQQMYNPNGVELAQYVASPSSKHSQQQPLQPVQPPQPSPVSSNNYQSQQQYSSVQQQNRPKSKPIFIEKREKPHITTSHTGSKISQMTIPTIPDSNYHSPSNSTQNTFQHNMNFLLPNDKMIDRMTALTEKTSETMDFDADPDGDDDDEDHETDNDNDTNEEDEDKEEVNDEDDTKSSLSLTESTSSSSEDDFDGTVITETMNTKDDNGTSQMIICTHAVGSSLATTTVNAHLAANFSFSDLKPVSNKYKAKKLQPISSAEELDDNNYNNNHDDDESEEQENDAITEISSVMSYNSYPTGDTTPVPKQDDNAKIMKGMDND